MFEHQSLDGNTHRVLPPMDSFIQADVLEIRTLKNAGDTSTSSRTQYGVINGVLVERYLPSEVVGEVWASDAVATPWWEVVGHPPHGGIVFDYNAASGGAYHRKLDPANNVVAFAQQGEEVTLTNGAYKVVRKSDNLELIKPTLQTLRAAYYSAV